MKLINSIKPLITQKLNSRICMRVFSDKLKERENAFEKSYIQKEEQKKM